MIHTVTAGPPDGPHGSLTWADELGEQPTVESFEGNDPLMAQLAGELVEVWVPEGSIEKDWTDPEFALAAMVQAGQNAYGQPVSAATTSAEGDPPKTASVAPSVAHGTHSP